MSSPPPFLRHDKRLTGLAATVALHLALLFGWHVTREGATRPDSDEAQRIQWVKIAPPRPARKPPPATPRHAVAPSAPTGQAPPVVAQRAPAAEPQAIASPVAVAEAAPARSAAQIMAQARKDLGAIDQALRKEFPTRGIELPPDSPQIRLVKGIELAAELAPPKWYEPAKMQEIIDPGGYGRRRYRVITSSGTYCITIESNHAPDGIDSMANRVKPKLTNCPPNEAPATTQKWSARCRRCRPNRSTGAPAGPSARPWPCLSVAGARCARALLQAARDRAPAAVQAAIRAEAPCPSAPPRRRYRA